VATLEAGSGSASPSLLLASCGGKCFALDISYRLLFIAKSARSKVKLIQADVFGMPFQDNIFDLTFSNSTLEHFSRPEKSIRESVSRRRESMFL